MQKIADCGLSIPYVPASRRCMHTGRHDLTKIMRVMRLAVLLLTMSFVHAYADGTAQSVTLSGSNVPLKKVFSAIREQTGYIVLNKKGDVSDTRTISLSVTDLPLRDLLQLVLKDQPLDYTIVGKTIVISRKEITSPSVHFPVLAFPLKVRVTDSLGNPLPGASVNNRNTGRSGITDAAGVLNLQVNVGDRLDITFIGFEKQTVTVKDVAAVLNVVLKMYENRLEEIVINKGYYTEKQRLSTGNVSRVDTKTIGQQPVSNPLMALQGRVPGIYVEQQTGIPGGAFKVRIRGTNSIRNGNDPLYVIDGVPFISETLSQFSNSLFGGGMSPLNGINPADIESIEILKDADVTAIYGSRGANGVVLITTKKGKAGKTNLDINLRNGISKALPRIKLMNTRQYILMRQEALYNDGTTTVSPYDYDINGTWDMDRYTDWQDVLFGGTANATLMNASLSGGSAETQYSLGAGFNRETTVFPGDGSNKRFSTHFNLTHASRNRKFNLALQSTYTYGITDFAYSDLTGAAMSLAPNAPALYTETGELNWENSTFPNPVSVLKNTFDAKAFTLVNALDISYKILPDLRASIRLGMTDIRNRETVASPSSVMPPWLGYTPAISRLNMTDGSVRSWVAEPQLGYDRQLGKGRLSLLIGSAFQQSVRESTDEQYTGFSSNALIMDPRSAFNYQLTNYTYSVYKYAALFGRINYNWDEKYIVNLTGRRDGSSRFGPGKRFANLGAAGIAWIFSKEPFAMERFGPLSYGKLRASYGITGNDQIGDYQFLDTYSASGSGIYNGVAGLAPSKLFNPDYGWETNRKLEGALELGFLKDKLLITAAYFSNRSSNQLVDYRLAGTTGFASVIRNLPAVVQNTGFEGELTTTNISRKNFSWTSSFNITINRNKLVAFPGIESSSYYRTYEVGRSLNIYRFFHYTGIDPETGLAQFEDLNHDGSVTDEDKLVSLEVGQGMYGGLSNTISFKGFQADIFFQFVKQDKLRNMPYSLAGRALMNQPVEVLEGRWRLPGDEAARMRFSDEFATAKAYEKLEYSDWRVVDATFIRLKNVSLSYQLPEKWVRQVKSRIYLQGQNLFTITGNRGLDPETGSSSLPPLTTIVAGLQLTF